MIRHWDKMNFEGNTQQPVLQLTEQGNIYAVTTQKTEEKEDLAGVCRH
jgi:hypothetical protein